MSAHDLEHSEATLSRLLELVRAEGGSRLVAILRHSARVDITGYTVEAAVAAPLTDEGRALALGFGRRLPPDRPLRLFHSEVERCIDTAERIAEGFREAGGQAEVVGSRRTLAASFIRDPYAVAVEFGRRGPRGFVQAWLSGQLGDQVLDPPDRACRDQLDALVGEPPPEVGGELPSLDLHISHDVNIVALLHLVADLADPSLPWPGYLGGVILKAKGGPPWSWWYMDRSGQV